MIRFAKSTRLRRQCQRFGRACAGPELVHDERDGYGRYRLRARQQILAVDTQKWTVVPCLNAEPAVIRSDESKPQFKAIGANWFWTDESLPEAAEIEPE